MPQLDSNLSAATTEFITSYGITLKNLVQAFRASGERLADFMEQRWTAVAPVHTALSPEVRRGAQAAQAVAGSVYHRGLAITTGGAEAAVDRLVELANQSVLQAAANASRFDASVGVTKLAPLAQVARVATPAAVAAAALANRVEAASAEWAQKLAGDAEAASAPAKKRHSAFAEARARRAA